MGTNFYMSTSDKSIRDKCFGYDYALTDNPKWGYKIHIAKTSMGWLPLFQSHDCIKSVKDIKSLYETGNFILYDEYGTEYNWDEFKKRVLDFNGGTISRRKIEKRNPDKNSPFYDSDMPNHVPVSHFEYANGRYSCDYITDEEGYEFTKMEFS